MGLTVCLSPAEVVTEIGGGGIKDHSSIEGGGVEEGGGGEELGPVEDEGGGKVGGDDTDEFAGGGREGGREEGREGGRKGGREGERGRCSDKLTVHFLHIDTQVHVHCTNTCTVHT